jgi:hypothetical protein
VYRVGHPHRSLRIQADSVRRNLDLRQNLANVGLRRQRAKRCPGSALAQQAPIH